MVQDEWLERRKGFVDMISALTQLASEVNQ